MTQKLFNRLGIMVFLLAATTSVRAQVVLFYDNFESGNLDQWTGKFGPANQGIIVPDPLNPNNHVLTFTGVDFGGDIFTAAPIELLGPHRFVLSFDFLGLPVGGVPPPEYGGFAGITASPVTPGNPVYWLAGTYAPEVNVPAPIGTVLVADGTWHHYKIDFTDFAVSNQLTSISITLEDWAGRGSVPGDVFFDNVLLVGKIDPTVFENLVPCAGPVSGGKWKNHGQYVSAMAKVVEKFWEAGLITDEEAFVILFTAARSNCGKN
jgi:hypothetical protein